MPLIDRATGILVEKFGATVSVRQIKNYISARWSDAEWHRLAPRLVSGKSTTKALNLDVILNAPCGFRQGMWDGYLAGDGSNRARGVTATSASAALCDGMAVLASSIGLITSKGVNHQHDRRTGRTYVSYQLWTPYVTHRQAKKASTARQLTVRRKTLVGTLQRMIDLEVDGGLYLVGDGLVTHNSVRDRPTNATEMVYLLAKNPTYFYDAEAVRQPASESSLARIAQPTFHQQTGGPKDYANETNTNRSARQALEHFAENPGANLRNFWLLGPEPLKAQHYAAYPTKLVEPCVLAGSREGDTVLDPFAGSGTTLWVARQHFRRAIGVELNPEYAALAADRLKQSVLPFVEALG
jgi:hypothetical protein